MVKLVRIEAPKIYLTVRFTELEAGTLATCELCLFVLLYLAFASVESPISCELPAVVVGVTGGLKGCRRRAIVLGYCSQLSIKLKIQDGARRALGECSELCKGELQVSQEKRLNQGSNLKSSDVVSDVLPLHH